MAGLNTGALIRFSLQARAQILSQLDDQASESLFGPQNLGIDWSLYDYWDGGTILIAPTDTKSIITVSGTTTVDCLVVKTSAPVDVNYTQDTVSRTVRVRPLVKPVGYFTQKASPSQQPDAFAPGVLILTGGNITAVSVAGVSTSGQSARVVVAVAGYNVSP